MARTVRFLVTAVILLGLENYAFAQDHGRPDFSLGVDFKLGIDFLPGQTTKFDNIPLALRQIPSHPDDTWIYGNQIVTRTIPFDSYQYRVKAFDIDNLGISPEVTVRRLRVRGGVNFSKAHTDNRVIESEGLTKEINQYGRVNRGYGTSLVYYIIEPKAKSVFNLGWVGETEFEIGKGFAVLAGYRTNSYDKIVLESGWDRYDMFEKYKNYDLASYSFERIYSGFGIQPNRGEGNPVGIYFVAGKMRLTEKITKAGKGIEISRPNNNWFVGFNISVHTVLFKIEK